MFRKMANSEEIGRSLKLVLERIQKATDARPKSLPQVPPRLVAVSKTKPASDIISAYQHGQRHFGENYVTELEEKSNNSQILQQCKDIKWHFVGHLQRNKASKVTAVPNLYMVETVDNQKLAQTLNNHWEKYRRPGKLYVMVQVNTSGEASKSGCNADELHHLVKFVREKCPCLLFSGLMTIGAIGYDPLNGPNPDFVRLVKYREGLCEALSLNVDDVELSMGMSSDYEQAIDLGSTNIRVGSTIFGARNKPNEAATEPQQSQYTPTGAQAPPTAGTSQSNCSDNTTSQGGMDSNIFSDTPPQASNPSHNGIGTTDAVTNSIGNLNIN